MVKIKVKIMILLILVVSMNKHQVKAKGIFGKVAKLFGKLTNAASNVYTVAGVANDIHDVYTKFTTASTDDIIDKAQEIAVSLDSWGAKIEERIQQSVDTLLTRLPLMGEITDDIRLLNTYIGRIDELYADMDTYVNYPESFSQQALDNLVKAFTSRNADGVHTTVNQMHILVAPQRLGKLKKSLFVLLAQQTRDYGINLCDTMGPPQKRLVDFYEILMETEIKAFAVTAFGVSKEGLALGMNMSMDLDRARDELMSRAEGYEAVLVETMFIGATQFRRCDPPGGIHERETTFYEFSRFLQGYVVDRSLFREDHVCQGSCGDRSQPGIFFPPPCEGYFCKLNTECSGHIANCQSMDTFAEICGYTYSPSRRYEWFEDKNDNVFGDYSDDCPGKISYKETVDSCDLCRCICVEDTKKSLASKRFINLRSQVANVRDNMVVTGLKFTIIEGVAHLVLQQGKLGPRAEIIENSTSWLEPDTIVHDSDFGDDELVKKFEDGDYKLLTENVDYGGLSWESRRINLDTLTLPKNYVLTGVRFGRLTGEPGQPFQLEIEGTKFDSGTGMLNIFSGFWMTSDDMSYAKKRTGKDRIEYKVEGYHNPIKSVITRIDATNNTFMDMSWTSFEGDAAQTTIPLLDGLPVFSEPPIPLVGVGLYHKKQSGYGGFLTLVLEAIDQSRYLEKDD